MRNRCLVPEQQILACLQDEYGLVARELTFLPLSHSESFFLAETGSGSWFLKLKKTRSEAGMTVARLLADRDVPVAAPVLAKSGRTSAAIGAMFLLVFPFIRGTTMIPATMTDAGWESVGAAIRKVHDAELPESLRGSLDVETFVPYGEELLPRINAALRGAPGSLRKTGQKLAEVWLNRGTLAEEFLSLVHAKGEKALRSGPRYCLCHGDFQQDNVLLSESGFVTLIDWDFPAWSPAERDLMFIPLEHRVKFERGYGPMHVNPYVMDYLAANWVLQESFDFAQRIVLKSDPSEEEVAWALASLVPLLSRMEELLASRDGS